MLISGQVFALIHGSFCGQLHVNELRFDGWLVCYVDI